MRNHKRYRVALTPSSRTLSFRMFFFLIFSSSVDKAWSSMVLLESWCLNVPNTWSLVTNTLVCCEMPRQLWCLGSRFHLCRSESTRGGLDMIHEIYFYNIIIARFFGCFPWSKSKDFLQRFFVKCFTRMRQGMTVTWSAFELHNTCRVYRPFCGHMLVMWIVYSTWRRPIYQKWWIIHQYGLSTKSKSM